MLSRLLAVLCLFCNALKAMPSTQAPDQDQALDRARGKAAERAASIAPIAEIRRSPLDPALQAGTPAPSVASAALVQWSMAPPEVSRGASPSDPSGRGAHIWRPAGSIQSHADLLQFL
eukprot:CAMPEP_0170650924 /NCGR_PEP_ID=MMETSP0224-20130122/46072_1 /TAXON_ID=285029 /ORGANISM="Togula jolla, Strain CCCM 725" /LENGTH=117 /DNA_ID=CAMNT_0010982639 /DNA_START=1149 /DNA_END=1500 /DNA_ORIENTATION=-